MKKSEQSKGTEMKLRGHCLSTLLLNEGKHATLNESPDGVGGVLLLR